MSGAVAFTIFIAFLGAILGMSVHAMLWTDEAVKWADWAAAGFEDTELRCFLEPEVGDGEKNIQPRVQA
jgi:hypothetical protein